MNKTLFFFFFKLSLLLKAKRIQNLLKWSLLDMRLSGIMIGGWGKGATSLCGRERKTARNSPPQGTFSHHLPVHLSVYEPATRTLKLTISRVNPMQRAPIFHSLAGCATISVFYFIARHYQQTVHTKQSVEIMQIILERPLNSRGFLP